MKILITGSSGFIGSALVNHLASQGHNVMGIDIKEPKPDTASHEFIKGSILNKKIVGECFSSFKPEVLIHLAAHMSLRESADAENRYRTNTEGTQNLIDAARDCESTKRAVYTSTKYIYRDGNPAHDRDYNPDSSYGKSKVAMEKMIWDADGGDVEWCITRPTTIWGPGMSKHYQRFLRMVQQGKYFHIGNKNILKHMGYVGNTAVQYERLAMAPSDLIHKKVFYMSDYEPEVLKTWVESFNKYLGNAKLWTIPMSVAMTGGWVGDVIKKMGRRKFPFTSFRVKNLTKNDTCNIESTEKVCGKLPYTTDQGAKETVDWFLSLD